MKSLKLFWDVLGYIGMAIILFLVVRIGIPYLLSQPSDILNICGYASIVVLVVMALTFLGSSLYQFLNKEPSS